MIRIASGVTDQVVYFFAPPGITGHTVDRARNATSLTAMTTPTITEMADGLYALLLDEDMTIDSGNLTEAMVFMVKAGGMSDTPIHVELFAPILTTQLTEAYAADGVAPTLSQLLFLVQQLLGDFKIVGTTLTVRKIDGVATAATFTLDDGTNPTDITRAT